MTATRGPLAGRVVGVYGSGGAPWHHLALAATLGADVRPIRAEDVAAGRLDALDVLVVPGGGATAMSGLLGPLGTAGGERIRRWVEAGGTYVSSCAGSVLPLALADAADAALPIARSLRMVPVALANPGDATLGGLSSPGVGRITVRLDQAHPFTTGLPSTVEVVHYNGPLFDMSTVPESVRPFAWPIAATATFTPAERFLVSGRASSAAASASGGPTVLERCILAGAATGLDARVDRGRAVLFGSHPEFGSGPLLLGWGAAAAMLTAALADPDGDRSGAGTIGPDRARDGDPGWAVRGERAGVSASELSASAAAELRRAAERFSLLGERDPGGWLDPDRAASFHGRDARTAWREDALAASRAAVAAARDLEALAPHLGVGDHPWLDDAERPDQDFGAMGLTQLLTKLHTMLDTAERCADAPAQRPAHAYDLFDSHPFHQAVGSYLSAAGLTAAALLTVVVLATRRGAPAPETSRLLWSDAAARRAAYAAREGIPRCS